ncbi:hypothetical protein PNBC_15435 [Paenibacillus crassostreae]|uniref:Uncharacterized protein n=1 Tax=Paenibacillus crassostreae TaxID=1763538 RepID=A0A167C625_9BACL|nr:hypothetical protein LPB68_04815 [Paenibacillus crassostreae]OAB72822.1 hypothetical protein PNBC_15435 [Paenibacillus crassostreae]
MKNLSLIANTFFFIFWGALLIMFLLNKYKPVKTIIAISFFITALSFLFRALEQTTDLLGGINP